MPADADAVTVPRLTDGVITLRELTVADIGPLVEQSRDADTSRWTFVPDPYDEQDARDAVATAAREWADDTGCGWAVEHEGAFRGFVSHQPRGGGAVEVAYAAHPSARGKGLMTRAVRLAVTHAFEHGAEIVLWHAAVGNFGSLKVAWRCGFTLGGPTMATRHDQLVEIWSGHLRPGDPMEPRGRWLDPPRLEGRSVRVRPFREQDAGWLPTELDPASRAYAPGLPTPDAYPSWLLARRTRAASGTALSCAISDARTDELLGGVDLNRLGDGLFAGSGILGYWLLETARGRGAVAEALELFVPWAFRAPDKGGLGLHRLEAGCAVSNLASARVLRRAGFAPVGVGRQAMTVAGVPEDELVFDLLASDDREASRVEPLRLPVLTTPHFRLRPWRADDVPDEDEGPDPASLRFMPAAAHPDRGSYAAWFARRLRLADAAAGLDWCLADRETDHALGNVTLFALDPGPDGFQGELGYWLHPSARGRRVLAEVLPLVVDHAFRPVAEGGLGLTRLHAGTVADNLASQRILERLGFRRWGQDRQAWRNGLGELTDGAYFELLASDPRPVL